MLKRLRSLFGRDDDPDRTPELTPEDHRALDEAAWRLVDALRAYAPHLRCEVRAATDHREVALSSPNPDLPAVMLAVDRNELRLVYGNDIHWSQPHSPDATADAEAAVGALAPLLDGREFLALRRLDGHVVESAVGSLDAGVTGLWPEAMTRERLGRGELITELQGWSGPVPDSVAAHLRNRPPSESQARLERSITAGETQD